MRVLTLVPLTACLLVNPIAASAAGLLFTSCQKNLSDGRVLIQDFTVLPSDDATFRVLKFQATKREGDWSTGPCIIEVTGPIPPVLSANKVCRQRASVGGPFDRSVFADCKSNEARLRPSVEARWPSASPELRDKCLKYMGDAYASLDGCLLEGSK